MVGAFKFLFITSVSISLLFEACKDSATETIEAPKSDVQIDSANDAWLDCYINQQKWEKSDSLSAKLSVISGALFLDLNFRNNSVTFKDINFRVFIGNDTAHIKEQLCRVVNDTLLATIIYSFAEIDYSSESLLPVNHLVFEIKPTALVCISKVDTVNNSIGGTFKAIAIDEKESKYLFSNGIFRNIGLK